MLAVETTFSWTKDFAFINGTFRVTVGDRVDLEGTQVIGWDPVAKKIRSWIFDTKAGFGEGEWSRAGNTVDGEGEKHPWYRPESFIHEHLYLCGSEFFHLAVR